MKPKPSVRAKGARALATGRAGRFLVVALPAAIIAGLLWRDHLVTSYGLGLVPLGAWIAVAILMATSMPTKLIKAWRPMLAGFVLAVAATGVLGMFNYPIGTVLGEVTSGGNLGRLVARAPLEWPVLGPGPFDLALASLRVAIVVAVAGAILSPSIARRVAVLLGRVGISQVSAIVSGISVLRARMAERSARLRKAREAERLTRMASVDTEASMLEEPPTSVGRPKPIRISTTDTMDDDPMELAPTHVASAPKPGVPALASPLPSASAVGAMAPAAIAATAATPQRAPIPSYNWKLPGLDLLKVGKAAAIPQSEIEATSDLIVETLGEHGVEVKITQVTAGPAVTMYGIAPGWERARQRSGKADRWEDEDQYRKRVRVDTILAREKDLSLALASPNIRFEAPIPGESLVGIEVPNANPSTVTLRSVMQSDSYREFEKKAALPVALGIASSSGEVFADLAKMPHLLVAGATGSGKSVCMNTVITGFLLSRTPAQLQMVLIDPKRVELTPYAGVPHLACPPVVEADRAVRVLKAVVKEMMARYAILESAGAKNIASYNEKSATKLPYLVVAVDELADLMLTSANEVERLIVRLAQLGRATGIHLIVATQRPSVDVVTGLIKANFPSRIAFAVSSQVDSRTILDTNGAERLLGRGDMLFLPIDRPKPMRVQGAFLADNEVESVVRTWRSSGGPRMPELEVEEAIAIGEGGDDRGGGDDESLFDKAQELARAQQKLSTSLLQRRLRIGYPRAARLMDELEDAGVVGAGEPGKPRQVLIHQ